MDDTMENNRVFLIITSVTLFVALVVGVGLWAFYPRPDAEPDLATRDAGRPAFDPIQYMRSPDQSLLFSRETTDEDDVFIIYGTDEDAADIDDALAEPRPRVAEPPVTEPRPDARPPVTAVPPQARTPAPTRVPTPAPSAPAPTTAAPSAPSPTAAAPRPTEPTAPREVRVTEYWIQVISSPNRDTAEQARVVLLEDYSLGTRITTREVDGTTFYRLRIGPFTERAEAGKFLDWVRRLEGFAQSYISEEYPLRTASR
ncbi:MAG: SPOR domain-containing protein [Spirochaetaceae bacterium]|nr:MAG: SPOR domain-containing protein [Spirochaetaceae bacterium]